MLKLLLFGASGNLGKEIAKKAILQGYNLTIVIRNQKKATEMEAITTQQVIVDVTDTQALTNICNGFDIVISALGKSVSPYENSKATFTDIDLRANSHILTEAINSKVKKIIYISAFHAELYQNIEYFRVHDAFSKKLMSSGIDYAIIKPPALFSGYIDMIDMARKGRLFNIGKGDKKTNPVYEGDVAIECINAIGKTNAIIECGGSTIYTRRQINEIIQQEIMPTKRVKNFPFWLFKFSLPFLKVVNKNLYEKFAFFTAVIQRDTVAPLQGQMSLEEYIRMKNKI